MREIISIGYNEIKKAQGWDPNLQGATELDVARAADPPQEENVVWPTINKDKTGVSLISNVDFNKLKVDYTRDWGDPVPPEYDQISGPVDLEFHFTYSFSKDKGARIIDEQDIWVTPVGQKNALAKIVGDLRSYLFEYFGEEIKNEVVSHMEPEYLSEGPDTREELLY